MYADEFILRLNHVQIENKNLLPEYSGIYYVIDEKLIVWYIGQSKNLQKRWNGEHAHHRFHQLMSISTTEKKQFFIYFYQIAKNQLRKQEKKHIDKYQPRLNYTSIIKSTNLCLEQISCLSSKYKSLKIFSNPLDSTMKDNFSEPKIITEAENKQTKNIIIKEKELPEVVVNIKSNQFTRKFIKLKDEKINLNLQIEICIDSRKRLFVRHYTLFNIYGWGIKIIQEANDNNVKNALSNLNSQCYQLYNYSFKWLGYKLNCENVLLIDEEDDFEIDTLAIMLPFRMFVDLIEYLWIKNSSLSENLETQETAWFKSQFINIKIAKYLHDNNLSLMKLIEKINS